MCRRLARDVSLPILSHLPASIGEQQLPIALSIEILMSPFLKPAFRLQRRIMNAAICMRLIRQPSETVLCAKQIHLFYEA